ncbi:MAG: C_GCAxxG_C_C family protein [Clostridia bacterium]|nr:C_GCAxxG_C_C family protein [Clostridia bacterium]
MTHREKAIAYFCAGYNCAQAVFAAFCDVTGYGEEEALMLASSFGGGMGRMRETCGACSAMFMVAGAVKGYTDVSTDAPKKAHYERIQKMAEEFKKEHGTITCRELLVSLKPSSTPTPSARTEEYYRVRPCVRFVATAADILDRMLEEDK